MRRTIVTRADTTDGVPKHDPARDPARVARKSARQAFPPAVDHRNRYTENEGSPLHRAATWCAPWSIFSYPGHGRVLTAILGISSRRLYQLYREQHATSAHYRTLAAYIRQRCAAGLALANQLDDMAAARDLELSRRQVDRFGRRSASDASTLAALGD